jgi:hypothetical protein
VGEVLEVICSAVGEFLGKTLVEKFIVGVEVVVLIIEGLLQPPMHSENKNTPTFRW